MTGELTLSRGDTPQQKPESSMLGALETSDFPVQGMTCAGCVGRVERALKNVPGVQAAQVNLATQRATVHYDPTRTTPERLTEAVAAAGYQVPAGTLSSQPSPSSSSPQPSPLPARSHVSPRQRALALAEAEQRAEHGLRRDLLVAAVFSAPLLIVAMSHGAIPHSDSELGRVLQLGLATPVLFGPGLRFFKLAWKALTQRTADMNTLVSIGALAAYGYSALAVLAPALFSRGMHGHAGPPLYFEAGAAIVTFVLLGKLLEARARKRLSIAVSGLGALIPRSAQRLVSSASDLGVAARFESVDVDDVARGDRLLVRAGERVPNDGQVLEGHATVDESMLTGESIPVAKTVDGKVYGGSLLVEGALTVRVTETGGDTALGRIVEAVEQAQGSRAPVAQLADRVSAYFVPFVLGVALLTLGLWLAIDASGPGLGFAIERFVAVLVIACPCALGLATPAAVAVGTGRAAELGVLFKGGRALEAASQLQTLLFDKTGTLTEGAPALTDIIALPGQSEGTLLSLVAAVEQRSEHPVARAIVQAASARALACPSAEDFVSLAGCGAEASVQGKRVRVGTAAWLAQAGISADALEAQAEQLAKQGRTPSFVAIDGQLAGLLALADRPAAHAADSLRTLEKAGFELAMLTGDRKRTALAIAAELGLTRVFAELGPADKARIVREEKQRAHEPRRVAMIGDGINDAPALAAADVGIAVAGGTDVALATADVVLMHGGVATLPVALALARATMHTIRQNLFWAFVYNVIGIPLAAGALFPFTGWLLSPVFASAAMSLSSVCVLANSLRLRGFQPPRSTP